jgi:branched-chain amino acid transport system permease protein
MIVLAALVVYPFVVADYQRALMSDIFNSGIFAMSLDLLLGFTELITLGHAGFGGLMAYVVIVFGSLREPRGRHAV